MKKAILPIMAAIVLALGFSSCQHQTMETMEVTITAGNWVTTDAVSYYFATVRWDELDEDVVDYGTVNAYLIENGRQNLLPYVYPIDYSTYDENGDVVGDYVFVPENLRFDYRYGEITFIISDLDGMAPEGMSNIPPMTFRVVAIGD